MAPRKRAETPKAVAPIMCANHPDREAEHTTSSALHQTISLCQACVQRVGAHILDH